VELKLSRERGHSGWGAMPSATSTTWISVHVNRARFEEVFRMSDKPAPQNPEEESVSGGEKEETGGEGEEEGEEEAEGEARPTEAKKPRKERNQRILPGK
jgi:hypothetical protein